MDKKLRLGEILLKESKITQEQLDKALDEQRKNGLNIGKTLVMMGFISEADLQKVLSEQLGIELVNLNDYKIDSGIAKKLPEVFARRYRAIILEEKDGEYLVGMVNPSDIQAVDIIDQVLNAPVKYVLVSEKELLNSLDIIYRRTDEISQLAGELHEEMEEAEIPFAELKVEAGQVDAPVVKLLQSVFEDAVQVRASDIHIEPDENFLRIRLRVDGVLQEQIVEEKNIAQALALRVKLMAALNVAETRLPQDGRFNIKVHDKIIDIRLSMMPTMFGESIVMRLLDRDIGVITLEETGLHDKQLALFRRILKQPYGLILVTGPTGSGKSTTLHAALMELNKPDVNIISIEDPVEYRLSRINQVQVREKIGLTFANIMRSVLRQDPDIIMLGEMRDEETAEMAMRAALTGHLVFSTLHTNDAGSSALRLMDMGVEGFMVSATLRCVLAQRLVRKICSSCITSYEPSESEIDWLQHHRPQQAGKIKFKHGKGCNYCNHTGYKGRSGVFELLELNKEMMNALRDHDPSRFSVEVDKVLQGKLLIDHAIELVSEGITTLAEAIRVAGEF